jgi:hypothetical protein
MNPTTFNYVKINLMENGYKNNYAIVPQKYSIPVSEHSESRFAVVQIFPSILEARSAVLSMQEQGLDSHQISMVAKNPQKLEISMKCENIAVSGNFLAEILAELGISDRSTCRFVDAVENDNFLVIAIGNDWEASKAQHVLDNIGNWQFNEHFKSMVTLPEQLKNMIGTAICIH